MSTKVCSVCKHTLPLECFAVRKTIRKDGSVHLSHYYSCKPCKKAYKTKYNEQNEGRIKAYHKQRYERDKESASLKAHTYYLNNRENILSRTSLWQKNNKNKVKNYQVKYSLTDKAKARFRRYYHSHSGQVRSHGIRRKMRRKLSNNGQNCNVFYTTAKLLTKVTGIQYQVDHFHPLQHPSICGLHVPANLRVVTAKENLSKNNKFTPYGYDFINGCYYDL